uniref:Uncharacterized protein n=1 Tax=Eptatretus burgeri TaxID=7764 RepID=A0A8C4N372_EPTBU
MGRDITGWTVMKCEPGDLQYLADADLVTTDDSKRSFKAAELWQKQGAVIMVVRRPG